MPSFGRVSAFAGGEIGGILPLGLPGDDSLNNQLIAESKMALNISPPSGPPPQAAMSLNDLAQLLQRLTSEHYATRNMQPFFRMMLTLALRGMGIGNNGNVDQSGELAAMSFIRSELSRLYSGQTWTIFDVGANTGQFIAAALQIFGTEQRRFYCFEPSHQAFAQLQMLVAARVGPGRGAEAVSVHNLGLGDKEEKVPLYSNAVGAEIGSLYKRQLDHIGIAMQHMEDATIQTLDGFAKERGIERIHFLKLDTEGHELKCIQGARGLIDAGRIDFIQFEMGCNVDARTYFRDFWHALPNYRIGRILRDGVADIERYQESEEQFGTQNLLAILRR